MRRSGERNFDCALRMAEIAAGLGAPSIRVFRLTAFKPVAIAQQTAAWIVDSLGEVARRGLKSTGVEVWLETHGDFAAPADGRRNLAQVNAPRCRPHLGPRKCLRPEREQPILTHEMMSSSSPRSREGLERAVAGTTHYVLTGEGEFPFDNDVRGARSGRYRGFRIFRVGEALASGTRRLRRSHFHTL